MKVIHDYFLYIDNSVVLKGITNVEDQKDIKRKIDNISKWQKERMMTRQLERLRRLRR